jgi:hypothetical protein
VLRTDSCCAEIVHRCCVWEAAQDGDAVPHQLFQDFAAPLECGARCALNDVTNGNFLFLGRPA